MVNPDSEDMVTVNYCSRQQMAKSRRQLYKEMSSLESRTIPHDCACGSSVDPAMVGNLWKCERKADFAAMLDS
jgi:hypothetical protein